MTILRATLPSMRLFLRENGAWYVQLSRTQKVSLGRITKAEAAAVFRKMEREALEGRLFQIDKGERITLAQWKEEYLAGRQHMAPATIRQDELALRSLGDVVGHNAPLCAITKGKIDEFSSVLLARGISKAGLNSYLRHIRAALNAAQELGYLEKPVKVKAVKAPSRYPGILSPEQIAQVLDHAKAHDPDMARIIQFALFTGCRRAEILGLRWEHVKGDMAHIIGKGDRERHVPLLPGAIEAMGEAKHIGPVFARLHLDTVSHRFKALAVAVGLPDVHFHNLRHSAATQMLSKGIPLPMVQEVLGHASIATTQIYAKVLKDVLAEEMKKLTWEK